MACRMGMLAQILPSAGYSEEFVLFYSRPSLLLVQMLMVAGRLARLRCGAGRRVRWRSRSVDVCERFNLTGRRCSEFPQRPLLQTAVQADPPRVLLHCGAEFLCVCALLSDAVLPGPDHRPRGTTRAARGCHLHWWHISMQCCSHLHGICRYFSTEPVSFCSFSLLLLLLLV